MRPTREWAQLLPLMRLEAFQPFSLAARKEVWRLRGVIASAYCRRPGAELDDRARDDVRRGALRAAVGEPTPQPEISARSVNSAGDDERPDQPGDHDEQGRVGLQLR